MQVSETLCLKFILYLLQNSSVGGYNTRGFVEVLAASQSTQNKNWFQGTADAVRQYMWLFEEAVRDGVEDFLILSGQ
jgi:glucose-1-phosphate adenylyltransferase